MKSHVRRVVLQLSLWMSGLAAAQAQVTTLETQQYGRWALKLERDDTTGGNVCTLSSSGPDWTIGLHIYTTANITLSIRWSQWSLRPDSRGVGTLAFDNQSFTASFTRYRADGLMAQNMNSDFLSTFRRSQRLDLSFPNGDRFPTVLPENQAWSAMSWCLNNHIQRRDPFSSR